MFSRLCIMNPVRKITNILCVDDVLRGLAYKEMTNYQEVANVVNELYRNPKPLIEKAERAVDS